MCYQSFCAWLISLNTISPSSIHISSHDRNVISVYIYHWIAFHFMCVCVQYFLCPLCIGKHIIWFHLLTMVNSTWNYRWLQVSHTHTGFNSFEYICPVLGLFDHMASVLLIFWETCMLFSIAAMLLSFSPTLYKNSLFLCIFVSDFFSFWYWTSFLKD